MTSHTSSLTKEMSAYDKMRSDLETDHLGKWVIMHDEVLVGIYESFEDAAAEAVAQFGRGPYLIRKVGGAPIALPASVLYAPVSQHAEG